MIDRESERAIISVRALLHPNALQHQQPLSNEPHLKVLINAAFGFRNDLFEIILNGSELKLQISCLNIHKKWKKKKCKQGQFYSYVVIAYFNSYSLF